MKQKYRFFIFCFLSALNFASPVSASEALMWSQASEKKLFNVVIGPEKGHVPISTFHDWFITIETHDGKPVTNAQIAITGGMPEHMHGMPSQPEVTRNLGNGRYLIEGMKFNMIGRWVLVFGVNTPTAKDNTTFNIELEY